MKKIVLTEDNQADVDLLKLALTEHHVSHELSVYRDGEAAMSYAEVAGFKGHPPCPDLLVLDLGLPKVGGLEVLSRFRSNVNCIETPVIVFTSSDHPGVLTTAQRFSNVRVLKKPLNLNEFLAVGGIVKQLLDGQPN